MPLSDFRTRTYSQFGEDGMLLEALRRLSAAGVQLDRWCCEFGAWDGVFVSNVCALVREHEYRSVFIESDPERCVDLEREHPGDHIVRVCARVGWESPDTLDEILAATPIPVDFDVLSIDIDGDDYWVLKAVESYRPKIVVVEFNPTIANDVMWVQPPGSDVPSGASPKALVMLGAMKGYRPVACTLTNLLLVRGDLLEHVLDPGQAPPTLDDLRDDRLYRVRAFTSYDGRLMTSKPIRVPWHRVGLRVEGLPILSEEFHEPPTLWPSKRFRELRDALRAQPEGAPVTLAWVEDKAPGGSGVMK